MECSSCSEGEGPFAGFLARSLASMRRELPWIFARLCARLCPRELRVEVDGEVIWIRCEPGDVRLMAAPGPATGPAVEARTSRQAILDLAGGRVTLLDALLEERLALRGSVGDVVAFHDGLLIYLHGAVRDPSFPDLLRRFQGAAAGGTVTGGGRGQ